MVDPQKIETHLPQEPAISLLPYAQRSFYPTTRTAAQLQS